MSDCKIKKNTPWQELTVGGNIYDAGNAYCILLTSFKDISRAFILGSITSGFFANLCLKDPLDLKCQIVRLIRILHGRNLLLVVIFMMLVMQEFQ